jgi:hypothetical protein
VKRGTQPETRGTCYSPFDQYRRVDPADWQDGALGGSPRTWQKLAIPLGCFARSGADMSKVTAPFAMATKGKLKVAISDIRIASATVPQERCSL